MQLRAHHLLCLLGFRGLGYSPEFVENLSAVFQHLRRCPETPVTLTAGADAVCRACPRLSPDGGQCVHDERIRAKDEAILARLGADAGERQTWAHWQRRVAAAFDFGAHAATCGECGWLSLGYCREGLAELRRQHGFPSER